MVLAGVWPHRLGTACASPPSLHERPPSAPSLLKGREASLPCSTSMQHPHPQMSQIPQNIEFLLAKKFAIFFAILLQLFSPVTTYQDDNSPSLLPPALLCDSLG